MARIDFTEVDKALADAEQAKSAMEAWISSASGDQAEALKLQVQTLTQKVTDLEADKRRLQGQLKDAQDDLDAMISRIRNLSTLPTGVMP